MIIIIISISNTLVLSWKQVEILSNMYCVKLGFAARMIMEVLSRFDKLEVFQICH